MHDSNRNFILRVLPLECRPKELRAISVGDLPGPFDKYGTIAQPKYPLTTPIHAQQTRPIRSTLADTASLSSKDVRSFRYSAARRFDLSGNCVLPFPLSLLWLLELSFDPW